ncbi:MAG: hypothetical protein ACE5PV_05185 [Candidatus Poribacteria bacterium]
MEQKEQKPSLLIINEPQEYQDLFIDAFDEEFSMIFIPTVTFQFIKRLKKLAKQEEICGAVCGLDASGITAQQSVGFLARQIFHMDIPIICTAKQEYDEITWKRLKGHFPELNEEALYFILTEEDDFSVVKSAIHQQMVEKEKRERKKKKLWYRLGRIIKDQLAIS